MIDFSNKINFLKPNIEIDYNKIDSLKNTNYESLLKLLEYRYKINKNQIELFNGYSSVIYSILKFLKLKYCFIYSPCTLEYKEAASNLDYEVRLINRFENLFLPIKKQSIVIFANPSSLDGTYYDLEKLFEYWVSMEATVLLDESLLDFSNNESSIKFFNEYSKVYVIKDLSEFYSNAELNISTIFSNKENIGNLRKFEPENKLSKFDIKYLEESIKDSRFKAISNSINIKNRIEIEKIFEDCKYVDCLFKSNTNSILIKLKDISSQEFIDMLEEKGIKLSNCAKYDFIDEYFINIYVNSQENIRKLKEVINAF
ncbi:hypothetical protein [Arcobacter sp. LA11]|uniref:hypothetical protein n=1 Tax=Arcobacter sp. LA11 TaxID=1898176 RepID=UPI000932E05C|nr:hypothetical protein [Arcobacter sp. LA11]